MNNDLIEDFEAYILEQVALGEMEISEVYSINKKIEDAAKKGYSNREGNVKRPFANLELGEVAYRYILDNGGSADEALNYSRQMQDKPEEWLMEVKNRRGYKGSSKVIVEKHKDHPVQKQMVVNRVFDNNEMSNSDRVNRLLRKLANCRKVNDRIEMLEEVARLHQQEIERMKTQGALNDLKMKHLESTNDLNTLDPKDAARELYKIGCKQKTVAEFTGKSLPTIKRWWKEFEIS